MNYDKLMHYFSHSVLFFLKDPENKEVRSKFEAEVKQLIASSKYAHILHFGTPAGTDRPVVDNSYTYSMIVTFETVADHDAYQTEDVHLHFINECKDLWTKVVIYDALSL